VSSIGRNVGGQECPPPKQLGGGGLSRNIYSLIEIGTVKKTEKERIRSQMRHQWPWPTCKNTTGLQCISVFARLVFGRVASIVCLWSKSAERILTNFSEKVSNDKICSCTAIPCSLLTGYHLAKPTFSSKIQWAPRRPQFLNLGGRQTNFFPSPQTLYQVSDTGAIDSMWDRTQHNRKVLHAPTSAAKPAGLFIRSHDVNFGTQ